MYYNILLRAEFQLAPDLSVLATWFNNVHRYTNQSGKSKTEELKIKL